MSARYESGAGGEDARRRDQLADIIRQGAAVPVTHPLSYAQQRLWFLDQLNPANPFYNIHQSLNLDFSLDVGVLERAFDEIVSRHEALRTHFVAIEGRPMQVVVPELRLKLPVVDLGHLPLPEAEAKALRLATEEAREPFDLGTGPLLRVLVIRLTPIRWVLSLTLHHIVSDGWSLRILFGELSRLYEAFAAGRPSPLPELDIQYADFALWQREHLAGDRLEPQLAYWREQLAELPLLDLPTDRPRPPVQSFEGATLHFSLAPELVAGLRQLSQAAGATLFMTLLTGFSALMARYSGQDDLPIGVPIAGRTRAELERLIGFFVNTLVLRIDLAGEPDFTEALRRVREVALGAYANQDVPFDKLVETLSPPRDASRNPLCQVAFQLFDAPADDTTPATGGPDLEVLPVERGTAVFDLVVTIWEGAAAGLTGRIEYSTRLFDAATIERLVAHFRQVLAAAVAAPDRPLAEIELMSPGEQAELARWNATAAPLPNGDVVQMFEAQAARTPDAEAVRVDGGPSLSYAELDRRSNQLAHRLQQLGVGPEIRVGLLAPRSLELVVGMLATLKAGGAYLPLDPAYPEKRLAYMYEDARPAVVLAAIDHLPHGDAPVLRFDDPSISLQPATSPALPADPDRLAYVIYTSGSTGTPKGVLVPCRGLGNLALEQQRHFGVGPGDRVLQFASPSFDASIFEVLMALCSGATLSAGGTDDLRPGPQLGQFLRREAISVVTLIPSALATLDPEQLPALRVITVAGEACPPSLVERWAHGRNFFNLYGPTEATIWATLALCTPDMQRIPIGSPIANVRCHVVDARGHEVPIGVAGELWLGGIGIARGYWQQPELTAERFVPDTLGSDRGTLYKTGDLVRRRSDGALDFLGRTDTQTKIRGVRIELGEIESFIGRQQGVRHAVVAVRGSGEDRRLAAFVVRDSAEPDDAASTHVDHWRELYKSTYSRLEEPADPRFNTVGWVNSIDGSAIPDDEMRPWLDGAVDRILAFKPRRVLEIGCGTGLVLFRVAPSCERYVATDIAPEALARIQGVIDSTPSWRVDCQLLETPAHKLHNLDALKGERFDTIILNSVVQYFPSRQYLAEVLGTLAGFLAPDGRIFLGDVRSLPWHPALATSIELARASDDMPAAALRDRVRRRLAGDEELVVDPQFFSALSLKHGLDLRVASVAPKRGRYDNELSRFRYDVTLVSGTRSAAPLPPPIEVTTLQQVRAHLAATSSDTLVLTGLLNRRVAAPLRQWAELHADGTAPNPAELRAIAPGDAAIDPDDLRDLAEEAGWHASVQCAERADRLDALFVRESSPLTIEAGTWPLAPLRHAPPDELTNAPLRAVTAVRWMAELRASLEAELPAAMWPAEYVELDTLPLTPNGKLDRKALPEDTGVRHVRPDHAAPATLLEKRISAIWSDLFGVDAIDVNDDFFMLGGHSLLAVQVAGRLRAGLDVDLPLRLLFEHRTVRSLAHAVEEILAAEIAGLAGEDPETTRHEAASR